MAKKKASKRKATTQDSLPRRSYYEIWREYHPDNQHERHISLAKACLKCADDLLASPRLNPDDPYYDGYGIHKILSATEELLVEQMKIHVDDSVLAIEIDARINAVRAICSR